MSEAARQPATLLCIRTFGGFGLTIGGRAATLTSGRSRKMWDLFKFFLTMRGKKIPVSDCCDAIWGDESGGANPSALHNLVYRLRKTISRIEGAEGAEDGDGAGIEGQAGAAADRHRPFIVYSGGNYMWNDSAPYWLDAQEFEELSAAARRVSLSDKASAIELYASAASLYQGEYLPEYAYNDWVAAARNRYSRLYTSVCTELISLLLAEGRHEEIAALCEKYFAIDPMDDKFHASYIDALLGMGRVVQAQSHYQYVTSMFYKEIGVKPTTALKQSYEKVRRFGGFLDADLAQVQTKLNESSALSGAYVCDIEAFRSIYQLESRRMPRQGYTQFICLATLVRDGGQAVGASETKPALDLLLQIAAHTLRSGDVVSRWNDRQLVLLLPSITVEDNIKVMDRLERGFTEGWKDGRIGVRLEYSPVMKL